MEHLLDDECIADYSKENSFKDACDGAREWAEVIRSTPRTILLDLDDGAAMDRYRHVLQRIKDLFGGLAEESRWKSKSGIGTHVVVKAGMDLTVEQRLLLQCALGSDPIRESLGLNLLLNGVSNPIALFKPKGIHSECDNSSVCRTE